HLAAGEDLELLADLRDDAAGRRAPLDELAAGVLRRRPGAQEEAARVVGPRAGLALGIEEAPAGQQRQQVEVGVLLAPEDALAELVLGERQVAQQAEDVRGPLEARVEAAGRQIEREREPLQEAEPRLVELLAEREVVLGERLVSLGPHVV